MTEVHDAGALLFFVPGVCYIALQSLLSYRARPFGSSPAVCRARSGIAALAAVALFPSILSTPPPPESGPSQTERETKQGVLSFMDEFSGHLCVLRDTDHPAQRRGGRGEAETTSQQAG